MRSFLATFTFVVLCAAALSAQTNPVPFVNQPLVPATVTPGSASFTLTVNGTNFVSTSVVNWNGSPRATTFVSSSQLTAMILGSDVAVATTGTVTVFSPIIDGGTSNPVAFTIAAPRSVLSFSTSFVAAGTQPASARIADLNHDGNEDIVAPNPNYNGPNPNTVSVLLGNGDGTFRPEVNYATGLAPQDVIAVDVNQDGKLDLVTANFSDTANSVSVLLGNGDGTFRTHVDYPAGNQPSTLAAADVNHDGRIDLVVADGSAAGVSVLLGNGDGTFQPANFYATAGIQTFGVAIGDFNHDGILDVVTADAGANSFSLLLGNGDGTFQPHVDFPVGNEAAGLTVADFNGDGNLDVAVSSPNLDTVSIFLGNGNGTFQPQVQYATAIFPYGVTTADVNGDGKLDLVVATEGLLSGVSVLLGNGDGTFQPNVALYSGGGDQVSAGDFNNDGLIDFSIGGNGVAVLLQDLGTVVELSPSSFTFGTQLTGTVSPAKTLTFTNSGSSSVSISSLSVGTANFAAVNKCPKSVLAGQSCRILVYFTPTTQGTLSDTLLIFDSGGGSPQFVSLSGTSTDLSISPPSLNFGDVTVGKTSPPQRVTLTNHGGTKIQITKISITGADKQDFTEVNACGTSLGAGISCTTDVWFTPKLAGSRSATLSITDTGGASPQLVPLAGTGQ